jgi:hypothetical protein
LTRSPPGPKPGVRRATYFPSALLWCARDVQHNRVYVNLVAAAFFVGGIGRLLSVLLDGAPHPFYVAMLSVELALPPLMVVVVVVVVVAKRIAEPR